MMSSSTQGTLRYVAKHVEYLCNNLSILLLFLCGVVAAPAPVPPAVQPATASPAAVGLQGVNVYQTNSSYISSYFMLQCTPTAMLTPSSTAEVADIVQQYYQQAAAGNQVTLRVCRPRFHSSATFVCPVAPGCAAAAAAAAADDGTLPGNDQHSEMPNAPAYVVDGNAQAATTIGILQSKLNKVLAVDKESHMVRVGAGMTVTQLLPAANEAGMSVQIGALPAYQGLTLAGILATSAHGTGDRTVSSLADMVLEITWVDGMGAVHVSNRTDPIFNAFNGGLGVFGVMTEMLLQLTPPTLTQLRTFLLNDTNMMDDINRLLELSPHILIHWRPDSGQFKAFLINEAPAGSVAAPGTNMTVLPNMATETTSRAGMFNIWHTELNDDSSMSNYVCPQVTNASLEASWVSVNGSRTFNATGPTNSMAASECGEHCTFNDQFVFNGTAQDQEFAIEFSQLSAWIEDVKRVFDVELKENGNASYRCMGLGYMWIRFGSGYDGLTALSSGMGRPVYVQSTWMRSRLLPLYEMRYKFVADLIEEVTLCKYKGRPHWGKNFDRTFTHPNCSIPPLYPEFDELLSLASTYDPAGMFQPRLFDKMSDQQGFDYSPHCSALNTCYCSEDSHCPVGHSCVTSLAFPDYKVCKAPMINKVGTIMPKMVAAAFARPPTAG